jgi:hypothetical protein
MSTWYSAATLVTLAMISERNGSIASLRPGGKAVRYHLDLVSVQTAKESGVSAYIAKPFSGQQLLAKLSAVLQ